MGTSQLSIVQTYYHQLEGMEPTSIDTRTSRKLHSDEQSYVRHLNIKDQWIKADLGWIKDPALVVIRNNEGRFTQRIPTPEEREESSKRVVEVSFSPNLQDCTAHLEILPLEAHPIHPVTGACIYVRCRSGTAKVSLLAIAR